MLSGAVSCDISGCPSMSSSAIGTAMSGGWATGASLREGPAGSPCAGGNEVRLLGTFYQFINISIIDTAEITWPCNAPVQL